MNKSIIQLLFGRKYFGASKTRQSIMGNTMLSKLFVAALVSVWLFSACEYQFGAVDSGSEIQAMNELNIPGSFNFETTQELEIVFPESHKKHVADVYQTTETDTTYLGRYLLDGESKTFTVSNASVGVFTVPVSFNGAGNYNYTGIPVGGTATTSAKAKVANSFTYMGNYNSQGVPDYLEPEGDDVSGELLGIINESLPETKPVPVFNPEYLVDRDMNTIITDNADVWITFVHEGAGWRNAIGYFTFDVNNPPASADDIEELNIIFPNASFSGSGGGLATGNKVYLGLFEANTGLGWYLLPNAWNGTGVNSEVTQIKYSFREFNTFTDDEYKQHMVFLKDEERELLLLGFEDTSRPAGDNDFNDAIFYVTANPYDAIETADIEVVKKPVDTDGDGVNDGYDDYPEDPERAYKYFYPSKDQFGTIAFEDRWPDEGDYDFNDVVIDYQFEFAKNADNKVSDMIIRTTINAVGGEIKSGFFYEFNELNDNQIESVTRTLIKGNSTSEYYITENYISMNPNGTEAGINGHVVIPIFDDAKELMPPPAGYSVTNVILEAPYVEPVTIETKVVFTSPKTLESIGDAPFNPFIVTKGNRGNEIHLPSYKPTELANPSLFGTGDDASNANNGSNLYKNSIGAPWAMHLPESFAYPLENENILGVYNYFRIWAESGGYSYMDWYMDKPSYRNESKIFQIME